jgi:hypothetical protein
MLPVQMARELRSTRRTVEEPLLCSGIRAILTDLA